MSELLMKSFAELIEKGDADLAKMYYSHTCHQCGAAIQFFKLVIKHCNIAQDPPVKFFCSKSCRGRWILLSRNNSNPVQNI